MRVNSIGLRLNYTNSWPDRVVINRFHARNHARTIQPFARYFKYFNQVESVNKTIVFSKFSIASSSKGGYTVNLQVYFPRILAVQRVVGRQIFGNPAFMRYYVDYKLIRPINFLIRKDLSHLLAGSRFIVNYIIVNKFFFDAYLVSNYITQRLANKFKLNQIARSVMLDVTRNYSKRGVIVQCSGRFDRKERASSAIFSKGKLSRSTLKNRLSYFCNEVTLKYGVCGIKVWVLN